MLTRHITPLTALLALILTLTATLALACGPAAPRNQADASPATVTPVVPATGGPSLLDGFLRARVAEYEAIQSDDQGPSGQASSPEIVSINVSARNGESRRAIVSLLADQGATNISTTGSTQIYADVPASLLPALAIRTDINNMKATAFPYPNLDPGLNALAVRYEAGLMPSEDVDPTYAMMSIFIEGGDNYEAIKQFLIDGGAMMTFGDIIMEDTYKPMGMLVAFVPVKLLPSLDGQHGIYDSNHELYPVPEALLVTEYAQEANPESTSVDSAVSGQNGAGGSAITPTPGTPTPAAGAVAHNANAWHTASYKGSGVKVGIIDAGYDGYQSLVPSQLPRPIEQNCYSPFNRCLLPFNIITDHGTAVAEAVIDVAPEAHLYLDAPLTEARFPSTVRWLTKAMDVDVIVQSLAWHYDSPGDGTTPLTGSISKAVANAVHSEDVVWVNAAGNEAKRTWFSASAQYSDGIIPGTFPRTMDYINFNAAADVSVAPGAASDAHCNRINLPEKGIYYFHLRWEDQWDDADTNLDISITTTSNTVPIDIASKFETLNNSYPVESFKVNTFALPEVANVVFPGQQIAHGDYCLRVEYKNGPEPAWIQLQAFGESKTKEASSLKYSTPSYSIVNPAEIGATEVLGVGAATVNSDPAVLPTSIGASISRGPLPAGDTVKPDVVGISGTYSAVIGGSFGGTSQAAPHVAGLAALFKDRFEDYSAALIAYFIRTNAVQRGTPDPNDTWGHGFAWLPSTTANPARPTGAAGTGGNQSITLTWNDAANATGFTVEQWDGRAVPPAFRELPFRETGTDGYDRLYTFDLTGAGANIGNLVNGVRYTHRIKSTNGARGSLWANWVHTGAMSPLAIPKGLSGTGRHRGVDLNWRDVPGSSSYEVQQWDGWSWRTLPFRNTNDTVYTITFNNSSARVRGLTNGVRYYHRVQAKNSTYESGWTSWIHTVSRGFAGDTGDGDTGGQDTQMPPPPSDSGTSGSVSGQGVPTPTPAMPQNQPSGLTARLTDGAVILHWVPGNNPNYVKQVVKRREAGVRPEVWTDFEVDVSAQTYTDRSAQSGKTYIYRIKGLRDNGRGGTSNRATVTTR